MSGLPGFQGSIPGGHESQAASRCVHAVPHCHLYSWGSVRQRHLHVSGTSPDLETGNIKVQRRGSLLHAVLRAEVWLKYTEQHEYDACCNQTIR